MGLTRAVCAKHKLSAAWDIACEPHSHPHLLLSTAQNTKTATSSLPRIALRHHRGLRPGTFFGDKTSPQCRVSSSDCGHLLDKSPFYPTTRCTSPTCDLSPQLRWPKPRSSHCPPDTWSSNPGFSGVSRWPGQSPLTTRKR